MAMALNRTITPVYCNLRRVCTIVCVEHISRVEVVTELSSNFELTLMRILFKILLLIFAFQTIRSILASTFQFIIGPTKDWYRPVAQPSEVVVVHLPLALPGL